MVPLKKEENVPSQRQKKLHWIKFKRRSLEKSKKKNNSNSIDNSNNNSNNQSYLLMVITISIIKLSVITDDNNKRFSE